MSDWTRLDFEDDDYMLLPTYGFDVWLAIEMALLPCVNPPLWDRTPGQRPGWTRLNVSSAGWTRL